MPDPYLIIDLVVIVALGMLGVMVLLQNRQLEVNRTFALFVLSVSIWILANYISNDVRNPPGVAIIANYFVFSFSYAAVVLLLRFALHVSGDLKAKKVADKMWLPAVLVGILPFTPYLVIGVERQNGIYAVAFGPAVYVYGASLLSMVFASLYVMQRNIRRTSGLRRARLKILFNSACLSVIALLLTQFILPVVTGWFGLTNIGILSMLILVFGLYYSVFKHRLFDLRLLTVRSLAYLLATGIVALLYVISSHYLIGLLSERPVNVTLASDVLGVGTMLVTLAIFGPLKRLFDRLTNKLFYHDAYDTQAFLDELNRALVSTYELTPLLQKSAAIVEAYQKAGSARFVIHKTESTSLLVIGSRGATLLDDSLVNNLKGMDWSPSSVIAVDMVEEDSRTGLYRKLLQQDISLVANLSVADDIGNMGYLLLGPKKSGNAYSLQDIKAIEIMCNELVIAIQNLLRFEEIKNFNQTLSGRVEDATKKLRTSNVKLQRLDEVKDEFVSIASHQLRTPLTSVKGYISMVLEGDAGDISPIQRKLLDQAFSSSQRMVSLINDFLNVSRLKNGKFVLEIRSANLATVVDEEVESLRSTANSKHITLAYKQPAYYPVLKLDEDKIRQVVVNFIDNAIHYSDDGTTIKVELSVSDGEAMLEVIDNGIGVPVSERAHLFTKFFRATNARRQRPDGTGVGLFLAKKIVTAHGGSIVFTSTEGKGSTFGFRLPIKKLSGNSS